MKLVAFVIVLSALPAMAKTVDVANLNHALVPADITAQCAAAEKAADDALAALVKIPDDKRTFADSFEALDRITGDYNEAIARLVFLKEIHPNANVRDAGGACEERAGTYSVGLSARKDLYLAMKGFLDNGGKTFKPDAEGARLIEVTMLDFKKSGLELSDKDLAKLVRIRQRISVLQSKFGKALGEDKTSFTLPCDDLVGLPVEFLAAHANPKKPAQCTLTTKYPDYYPVMDNAQKEGTRRRMEVAFMNRGGTANIKLLDEAIKLRAQAAALLGMATHVDVVAQDRMAKDAKTIGDFLQRMKTGLAPGLIAQTEKMKALKAAEQKTALDKTTIHAWDWRYYLNQIKRNDYAIDDEKVRSYFPMQKVFDGMFQVYATLFGISMREARSSESGVKPQEPGRYWADGVKLYEIHDAQSDELLAKFYVDMYPREGKYGHAAEFTLGAGHNVKEGYSIPMAALVVNFAPPQNGKPAMLSMKEVDTLFHEFGHVMHETLTTARYSSLSGTRTALDFVEAPSQMLENWVFAPEVLAMISQDPADPKKPMPKELADKLSAARKYDAPVKYSRQVFLGTFDWTIHTSKAPAADATARKVWADVMKFPEDKDAHFAAGFGHMMGGYDGGYYGYLWSEVFAADMFTRFQQEGVLSKRAGKAYRDMVISRGRTQPPDALLRAFLGREPNESAFLQSIGIGVGAGPAK
jgi:thimet oligopeptidase